MTKQDHSRRQDYQDITDHPDFSLYEGSLAYGAPDPETETETAPHPEAEQLATKCEDSKLLGPQGDDSAEYVPFSRSSDPIFDYPEQTVISYDPDLAFAPDYGPYKPPTWETDEDERGRLEIAASQLVMEIGSISMSRSAELHGRILSVLEDFPHGSSFEAIRRAIMAGHTVEDIVDACALKALWRDSSDLWLTRRYVRREGMVIFTSEKMRNSLTWISALQLVEDHGLVRAETGLTSDWVEGWISLEPPGREAAPDVKNEYYTYLNYALGRADAVIMRDPDEWPYQSLFDHNPNADPLVQARVIPAAFHQYETGGTRDRRLAGQRVGTHGPSEPDETDMINESQEENLARQREMEDILMMAAIRGHL